MQPLGDSGTSCLTVDFYPDHEGVLDRMRFGLACGFGMLLIVGLYLNGTYGAFGRVDIGDVMECFHPGKDLSELLQCFILKALAQRWIFRHFGQLQSFEDAFDI